MNRPAEEFQHGQEQQPALVSFPQSQRTAAHWTAAAPAMDEPYASMRTSDNTDEYD